MGLWWGRTLARLLLIGGNPVGYVDRMPKIYVKQGAAIAVAGLTSVEDELFSSFMRRNDYLLDSAADEFFYDVALEVALSQYQQRLDAFRGSFGRRAHDLCEGPR